VREARPRQGHELPPSAVSLTYSYSTMQLRICQTVRAPLLTALDVVPERFIEIENLVFIFVEVLP